MRNVPGVLAGAEQRGAFLHSLALCCFLFFFFGCGCIWCVSKVYLKELSLQSLSLLWTHEYCTLAVNGKKKKIDYCQFWL